MGGVGKGVMEEYPPQGFNPKCEAAMFSLSPILLTMWLGKKKPLDHGAVMGGLGHGVGKDAEGQSLANHEEMPCGFGLRAGA